jgi:hypothetical protein
MAKLSAIAAAFLSAALATTAMIFAKLGYSCTRHLDLRIAQKIVR